MTVTVSVSVSVSRVNKSFLGHASRFATNLKQQQDNIKEGRALSSFLCRLCGLGGRWI